MPAVASNPEVSVKVLVLQAEAHHRLQQFQEAFQVSFQQAGFSFGQGWGHRRRCCFAAHYISGSLVPSWRAPCHYSHTSFVLPQRVVADVLVLIPFYMFCCQALDLALQLQPSSAEALWLRAAVHAAAGHHMAYFMDLRNLSQQQPTYPGLKEALQQAARVVSQQQAAQATAKAPPRKIYIRPTRRAAGSSPNTAQGNAVQQGAYAVLGLQPGADGQAVRQAYKQLAARFHPDKWVLATGEQQADAEEQFKQVAAAYQSIMEAPQQ
jgi:DnaJ-domain-containing protein 1